MAKLTRVFAVAAFVLGIGFAAAPGASANHEEVDHEVRFNVFAQANLAFVSQVNANDQTAVNAFLVGQDATGGAGDAGGDAVNVADIEDVDQDIDQDQDVDQENETDLDQENEADDVDQENEADDIDQD